MSVSFSDLPKDVVWMIFQFVIKDHFIITHSSEPNENDFPCFSKTTLTYVICRLSLINKTTLQLVKSKTIRYKDGWLFIKGALLK